MAPGMGHCAGGDGPSVFHMVDPLEQWVEHGSETFPSRAPLPTIALARTSNSKLAEDASAQRRERPKRKITSAAASSEVKSVALSRT